MTTNTSKHPEDYCHRCGGDNVSWSAPSPLWNEVMRGGDINAPDDYQGIICPTCFIKLCEEMGVASGFRVYATNIQAELKEETPSGRIWNAKTWKWDNPPNLKQRENEGMGKHFYQQYISEKTGKVVKAHLPSYCGNTPSVPFEPRVMKGWCPDCLAMLESLALGIIGEVISNMTQSSTKPKGSK
jgi:hypothetical protein